MNTSDVVRSPALIERELFSRDVRIKAFATRVLKDDSGFMAFRILRVIRECGESTYEIRRLVQAAGRYLESVRIISNAWV